MYMEFNNFNERTLFAMRIAKEAGLEISKIQKTGNFQTKDKGIKDVLTIADTTSEKMIMEGIMKIFPNDDIIAEESGENLNKNSEYTWVIDPLDGTMNFSRGIPTYGVSVGYMKNGKPEGGAIYIPVTDELYVCEREKGAFCNDQKIHVSETSLLEKSLTTLGFNNRYPEMVDYFSDIHKITMKNMANAEKLFCTVISFCYVASGKTEAHMELYCYLWDICVGSLLVEEAGGRVSGINGEKLDFSKIDKQVIIATNKNIYKDYVELI